MNSAHNRNVIHIYGASGSGTTTLGRYISEQCNGAFLDTDDYFWRPTDPPYTAKRDRHERIERMKEDIAGADVAVISGSLVDWGDELIPYFALAVRLVTPKDLRIARLIEREKGQFGSRVERGGDLYQNHCEFLRFAERYDDGGLDMRSKAKHDEWQTLLSCRLLTLDGSQTLRHNWEKILPFVEHLVSERD